MRCDIIRLCIPLPITWCWHLGWGMYSVMVLHHALCYTRCQEARRKRREADSYFEFRMFDVGTAALPVRWKKVPFGEINNFESGQPRRAPWPFPPLLTFTTLKPDRSSCCPLDLPWSVQSANVIQGPFQYDLLSSPRCNSCDFVFQLVCTMCIFAFKIPWMRWEYYNSWALKAQHVERGQVPCFFQSVYSLSLGLVGHCVEWQWENVMGYYIFLWSNFDKQQNSWLYLVLFLFSKPIFFLLVIF